MQKRAELVHYYIDDSDSDRVCARQRGKEYLMREHTHTSVLTASRSKGELTQLSISILAEYRKCFAFQSEPLRNLNKKDR